MTPDTWQRVKDVVGDALDRPAEEREAFVATACGDDVRLRREVESMLSGNASHIERCVERLGDARAPQPDALAGTRLGAYEVMREIGRGAMGAVYLARRADAEFDKLVAVKILKRGTDTDEVLRRFRSERQILARLDHPNIARLFDGGTTDDGLPYFVMEYVDGAPITEFARQRNLSVRERIKLVLKVAAAVHLAHRNLVVHRDIKPGNILIAPDGEPKLLDFGIAKLLSPEGDFAQSTLQDQQRFTPGYASPEQVRGEPVTTLSDVYSLGALLYELLTGRPPHTFSTERPSATELFRVIVEQEAPRASTSAQTTDARRLLRGDLDNILLTALRKEPARRYSGVPALADDLRRHLEGRPIRARPATFGYRAAKFVRRNKVGVAATLLAVVAATAGSAVYLAQARREAAYFRDLRQLANLFIFKYHDRITALPGSTELRRELVKDALAYLNNLAGKGTDNPELLRELGAAYKRIGDVQGGVLTNEATGNTVSAANLGDTDGALESYAKALAIRRRLAALRPDDKRAQLEFAEILANMGEISMDLGRPGDAARYLREGIRKFEALREKHPDDTTVVTSLKASFLALGRVLAFQPSNLGDIAAGLDAMRKSISLGEALLATEPQSIARRQSLAPAYGDTGRILFNDGRSAEALDYYRKALALGEGVLQARPTDPLLRRELAVQHRNVGAPLLENGQHAEALEHFKTAVAIFEQMMSDDPTDARIRRSAAYGYRDLAEALAAMGDRDSAEKNFGIALRIFDELGAKDPSNMIVQAQQALTHLKISRFASEIGELPRGIASARRALEIGESVARATPDDIGGTKTVAEAHAQLGNCLGLAADQAGSSTERRQGWDQARESFQRSLDLWRQIAGSSTLSGRDRKQVEHATAELARSEAAL